MAIEEQIEDQIETKVPLSLSRLSNLAMVCSGTIKRVALPESTCNCKYCLGKHLSTLTD